MNNRSIPVLKDGASGAEEAAQDGGEQSSSPPAEKVKVEQSACYEEKVVIVCFGFYSTAGNSDIFMRLTLSMFFTLENRPNQQIRVPSEADGGVCSLYSACRTEDPYLSAEDEARPPSHQKGRETEPPVCRGVSTLPASF